MNNSALINTSKLQEALEKHAKLSEKTLIAHHPDAISYLETKGVTVGKIREHAVKLLTSGTLAISVLLASPALSAPHTNTYLSKLSLAERQKDFSKELLRILPTELKLTEPQEKKVMELIREYWGISATPTLEGQRLNHSYGFMGAEQHLPRYPGDMIQHHDEIQESGITPATGAWSYFAQSQTQLNQQDILREKYYVAVQTLYLPEWNTNTKVLKEWYKYRKVLVVNPTNGKIMVCDIADAGPSLSTGKQFGGSPEVMHYLELDKGMKKGQVILFFLDEKEQPVPLGPVEYNVSIGTI